jgi:uncharacterized membrane protein YfcA|tara:strand:- start:263 stop:991 length:729 start_codon:yes stop_codon:yes gene_type:complete
MLSDLEINLIILFLITIQSIIGVGILVIGTPTLLILNYDILDIYLILLPISILTSVLNLMLIRLYKYDFKVTIDKNILKKFFIICLPSVFIGLVLLQKYHSALNFKFMVSFIIIFSIILVNFNKSKKVRLKNIYLILTGITHGLTNSGGTLLSLFFSTKSEKNNSRYNITFFYFFLALFQYLMTIYIFEVQNFFLFSHKMLLVSLVIGLFLGNYFVKFVDLKKFKMSINGLAIIACCFLILS